MPIELKAACAILDEVHETLPSADHDDNVYTLGQVAQHNVVITCLPKGIYGTTQAANVAQRMELSFLNIQYRLMVGVGGGVPSPGDVRLGDVVIAVPGANSTGIVAYDHGKTTVGGHLEQTVILNKPPLNMLKAVPHLGLGRSLSISQTLKAAIASDPIALTEFAYPGEEHDKLFEAEYDHPDSSQSCSSCCNETKILRRLQRKSDEPHLHAGTIGSGNQVIKDARTRDSLAKAHGISCFEMEAAGLVDSWPCLVIRGICDYSDSHKQKQWQPYAAITAAACARSLLLLLDRKPHVYPQYHERDDVSPEYSDARKECVQALSFSNPIRHRQDLQERKGRRAKGTCEWMLKTNTFQEWRGGSGEDDSNVLWLHGLPASGKSMMTIFLTEALENDPNLRDAGLVIYFFCDSSSQNHTSGIAVLSGLIWQLIKDRPISQEVVREQYEEDKGLFTSFNHLWKLFIILLNGWREGKIYCVIDALDECDAESQNAISRKFESFFDPVYYDRALSHVSFLITSRPYEEIRTYLGGFVNVDIGGFAEGKDDVAAFIDYSVGCLTEKKRFSAEMQGRVRRIIQEKAEDTFLWVSLAMEEVKDAARADIIEILEQLPGGLRSLYGQLLERAAQARPKRKEEILRIINVVAVSLEPLSILQLAYACQLYAQEREEEQLLAMRSSIEDCKLLVVETNDKVALLHKSVKDFLADDRSSSGTGLWAAHAFLAYRCIDCCMESVGIPLVVSKLAGRKDEKIDDTEDTDDARLLAYATRFWPEHAHFAGEQFEITEKQEPFFKENSLQWQNWWLRLSASQTYKIWAKPSPFHIAATWGILPLVKYILQTTSVDRYHRTEYLDTDFLTQKGETALELAATWGHEIIVCHLLEQASGEMVIFNDVLEAAIKNTQRGAQIIDALFLHPRTYTSNWNHSHLVEAARNPICGREILQSLLKQVPKLRSSLDDDVLIAAAGNSDLEPMRLLLNFDAGNAKLSEEVLLSAVRNSADGYNMTLLLLSSRATTGLITERIIYAAAWNLSILRVLLRQYNGRVSATTLNEVAQAGEDRAHLLLQHCSGIDISSDDIPTFQSLNPESAIDMMRAVFVENRESNVVNSRILSACCRHLTGAQLSLILERRENRQHITSRLFASALKNGGHCIAVMESLRKYWEGPIPFGQKVIERLMRFNDSYEVINYVWEHTNRATANISIGRWGGIFNAEKGLNHVQALLDRDGGVMEIRRHDLYGADGARHASSSWNQILQWALGHPRDKLHITPRAMELILRFWSKPTARALLQQDQRQISFHEEALKIIVERFDPSDLLTVLNGLQTPLTVTDGILIAASRNSHCYRGMLRMLIDRMGQTFTVTPDIIRAIARADEGPFELLMSRNAGCFEITDDFVIEVFESDCNHSKIMRTLLSQNKEKRSITCEAAVAIVGLYDAAVVELLIREYTIASLSNNMIAAALSNSINSATILEILLRQSREWAFDGTWWSSITREISEDTFQWLHSKLFDNNVTSESFLEGALSNPRLEFQSICHLLESISAQQTISQRLVACSARNQTHSRQLVELMLARNDAQLVFITEDLVGGGLGTQRLGDVAMKDILSISSNRIKVTHNGVYNILRWYDQSTVDCLVKRTGTDFHFTADLIQALIFNSAHGKDIMRGLLMEQNIRVSPSQLATIIESGCFNVDALKQTLTDPFMRMTEHLFDAITAADDGYSLMDAYLNTHPIGSILITVPTIAKMVGTPHRHSLPLLKLLLGQPRAQAHITQPAIRTGLRALNTHKLETFIEILTLVISRGDRIIADEECMAELFAHEHADRLMETICHHTIAEELIISKSTVMGLKHYSALKALAHHAKFHVAITEAALCNILTSSNHEIDMHLLISRPNWKIPITEIVLCAGIMKDYYRSHHMSALFQHARHVQLTSVFFKILTEAKVARGEGEDSIEDIEELLAFFKKARLAGCISADMVDGIVEHCSPPIVLALFDRLDDPIPFSRYTLPFLARRFSEKVIAVFLDRHGNNSLITEEVLAAAASNGKHGPDVVTLLLQRSAVLPTESVLLAAATNLGQGLRVFTILLDHLSKSSVKIMDTDRQNDGIVLESLLAKDVLFVGLQTCFADNMAHHWKRASLQDQAFRIVNMFIERGVPVVFNEDDLLRLFELYTLAPHFNFILQTHRGRLPTITPNLIARVRLRVTKYLSRRWPFKFPYCNPTLYDPLFIPAIQLTIRDIDPFTFNSLMRQSKRPSEEIRAVVESGSGQWVGKQIMLQVLTSQAMEITGEMISKGALDQSDSSELLRQPKVKIARGALQRILQHLDPGDSLDLLKLKSMSGIIDEETWISIVSKFTNLDMRRLNLSLRDWKEVIEKAGRRRMISESVLSSVIRTNNYDILDLCLRNYHKPLVVTEQLVDAFAAARPDMNILRRLLEHESLVHPIHPSSLKRILEVFGSGIADELFKITKCRLLVDESLLVSIISTKNVKIVQSFFNEYRDDLTLTPRVVMTALQTNTPDHAEVVADDQSDESDESSEDSEGWPESEKSYDSDSSYGLMELLGSRAPWDTEPPVSDDESAVENLKPNEDTSKEYCTSAYLLECLLRRCSYDPTGLTEDILLSVIENAGECEVLFTVIAKYYNLENVGITETIAKAAASSSMRSVKLLMDLFPGKVPITEEVLIAATRSSKESYGTLRLLLSCSSSQISVSKRVMVALIQNPNSCPSAFQLVLEYGGSNLLRSQEIKTSIIRNAERRLALEFFLEQPGFSLTVTESMIRSDNENDPKDISILIRKLFGRAESNQWDEDDEKPLINRSLLFRSRKIRFTSASIAYIMAKGGTGSTILLLEKLATDRDDRHLTEDVFLHAISNEHKTACLTINHLLSRTRKFLTEKAWIAAARNEVHGWTLMQIFANYDPTLESMTPTVVLNAARNDKLGNHILKWLLSYFPTKVRFSEEILSAISGNPVWWTGEPLTSETYRPHIWQNGPILEVILHQAQDKARITQSILIAAVKNPEHSARYIRVLLQHPTREALNLQEVARVAAGQEFVEIKTLLSLFQHGAKIDEDIVVAAMRNSERGGDIFELLRVENLWGDFIATDKVVLAAAGNEQNGNDLLEDFLRSYQGVIVVQDEHIKKVAKSFSSDLMYQLRIHQRVPVSNPLPIFVCFHYLFHVLYHWLTLLYC